MSSAATAATNDESVRFDSESSICSVGVPMKKKKKRVCAELLLRAYDYGFNSYETGEACPRSYRKDPEAIRKFFEGRSAAAIREDRLRAGIPLDDMPWGFQSVQIDDSGCDIAEVFIARLGGLRT